MKQLLRLLIGLTPLLFLSCDYSPSGAHYEEINPNPEVIADITLHEEQDTIIIRGNKNLFFNVSLPGRETYGYKLELDDKQLQEGSSSRAYYFESGKFADGYHVLKFSAFANSGTGSLADKYKAEVVQVYRTWVVLIDNSPPVSPAITTIKPENGQLRISWEPYTGRWFKRMEIRRILNGWSYKTMAIFTDRNTTTWIDNSYVGGTATYSVVVHLDDNYYGDGTPGTPATFHYPLPTILSTTYNAANEAVVTFSSTPFYNNFESYTLSALDGHFFHMTNDINDTVRTFPYPGFGKDYYTSISTHPKNFNYNDRHELPTTWSHITGHGTPWGPFPESSIRRSAATNRFYIWQQGSIYLVDGTTLETLHRRDVGHQYFNGSLSKIAVSVNGSHTYVVLGKVIHKLNPATLQTIESYRLEDLLPSSDYNEVGLSISNDNRLMVAAQNYWTNRDTVYLMDMESKKVLLKFKPENRGWSSTISSDGKALWDSPNMYTEQSNQTWLSKPHHSSFYYTFVFHPTKPMYALKEGRQINFYSNETGQKVKTIAAEAESGSLEFDAGSDYLYENFESWSMQRTLYIYNFETGQLVRKLKLASSVSAFVHKDRIFSRERYIEL